MFIVRRELWSPSFCFSAARCGQSYKPNRLVAPLKNKKKLGVGSALYKHVTPQQPVKGAQLVGESPTRRIRRFTTERPDACPSRKAGGESSSGNRTDGPK